MNAAVEKSRQASRTPALDAPPARAVFNPYGDASALVSSKTMANSPTNRISTLNGRQSLSKSLTKSEEKPPVNRREQAQYVVMT